MVSEVERVKRRWEKLDEQELDSAVNALLQAPNGRRFLWWLLSIGKVGAQPFTGEALATAFSCGELNVGNQIMSRLTATNPAGYTDMMKDMLNERKDRDRELANASDLDRDTAHKSGHWGDLFDRDTSGDSDGDDGA